MKPLRGVEQQPSFPQLEKGIISFWTEDGTFQASIDQREPGPDGANEYVFYDGPPFANGLPHYGHLLTGYVKDTIPRYQTMQGRRVERRFGWDCHGLPAEMETERELGVSGHVAITEYGIDNFNEACKRSVLQYTDRWVGYVTRQARWVDFQNDYKTMDPTFMETTMWVFKQLWDKGLIYEGYKVLPYCYECETSLSTFETRFDDSTRERQDQVLTVWFQLDTGERVLVWTTTPWTLPSNLALAVGPDVDYAVFEEDGQRYILGEGTVATYEAQLVNVTRVGTIKGAELVGRSYTPMFDFFADHPNAFKVLGADFVDTSEGTGVVHMAPGFGEDDQRACEEAGISVVCPMNDQGQFTAELGPYAGKLCFDANADVIRDLKARGVVVRHDSYLHNYPHCWRSRNPLIYKACSSWFVKVTAVKERMLELNQEIEWIPGHIQEGSFGHWVANARDWAISRSRFWGSPLPVWRSDDPAYPRVDVYGSLDEIERDFGVRPDDLHRPAIDELVRPNPDDPTGTSKMRRVPEVLDCWFESGSMPYGQVHYPFENADWFEHHFPADFIVEYPGQIRAWFFYLLVMSTAISDRIPFRRCVVHGLILGDDGRKMSKSLRNYPDPEAIFEQYGADAMRWFLLSSAVLRGQDLITDERAIAEVVRGVINPIWNAWYFLSLYANADDVRPTFRTDAAGELDRYLLSKLHDVVVDVTVQMDAADLFAACASINTFLDVLTNWYIRRSRDRFWKAEHDQDKTDAYDTLATAIEVLCRVSAPLLPLITEAVWKGLTGARSVHLTDWPSADELPVDKDLVVAMDLVREVCGAAHSVRSEARRRVRLPLASLTVKMPGSDRLGPFADLIKDELNVKELRLEDTAGAKPVLDVIPAKLGPRLGKAVQDVIKAVKRGEWELLADGTVMVGETALLEGEFNLRLGSDDPNTRPIASGEGLIILDTQLTPELEEEGLARDIVREVNSARRDAGLQITDHIELVLHGDPALLGAVRAHEGWVKANTLADTITLSNEPLPTGASELDVDGMELQLSLTRAATP